jgi:hypothetical protein
MVGHVDPEKVGRLVDVVADGERAYLLGERGLQVADLDDTRVWDSVQVHGSQAITRRGRYVFVAGERTLEVLDVGPYQVRDPALASADKSATP